MVESIQVIMEGNGKLFHKVNKEIPQKCDCKHFFQEDSRKLEIQ